MANRYENDMGLTINGLHTYRDLGLVPAERPVIGEAKPRTKYVPVLGMNGSLDLSETLTGYPLYEDRECTFKFLSASNDTQWRAKRTEIVRLFHGKQVQVIQDREPDVYLEGRLTVEDPEQGNGSGITLTGVFRPYKMDRFTSTEAWEWDSFNFETGVVREYGQIGVYGSETLEFISSPMGGSPTFITEDSGMTVTVDGTTYSITPLVENVFHDIVLPNDYSTVEMVFHAADIEIDGVTQTGSGTVWVRYRGGRL